MDYLKNYLNNFYLNVTDLNNIVEQYLIGKSAKNKSAYKKNIAANLYGADLFIAEPLLKQLCRGGHILLVKKYIDSCDFNKNINNEGLKGACEYGHLEIVQFLVEHERELDAYDLNELLEEACYYGHLKIVKYLINKGANNLNEEIFQACGYGHLEIVQFLVEQERELDTYDLNELLEEACYYGHLKIVKYLINKGANNLNKGIFQACQNDHLEIVQFLVEHERELDAYDLNELLEEACYYGHLKIMQYLVEHGRKLNITFNVAECIDTALELENTQVVDYLLSLSF